MNPRTRRRMKRVPQNRSDTVMVVRDSGSLNMMFSCVILLLCRSIYASTG